MMGCFRLYLAMSVVFMHSSNLFGFRGVVGQFAVQSFFVVSGFYMAMVLDTKYLASGVVNFYINRILRLFPLYILVWLVSLAGLLFFGRTQYSTIDDFLRLPADGGLLATIFIGASNIFLLGQDLTCFFSVQNGGIVLQQTDHLAVLLQLVPQTWSVSLELYFYALAPWLARQPTRRILLAAAAFVGLRVLLALSGVSSDLWEYRFFPTALPFFLGGMLSYRCYRAISAAKFLPAASTTITAAWFFLIVTYDAWADLANGSALFLGLKHWFPAIIPSDLLLPLVPLVVPFLFARAKSSAIDRFIGELSYPIYLIHFFIIFVVRQLFGWSEITNTQEAVILLAVLALSACAYILVDRPLEAVRHGISSRSFQKVVFASAEKSI